MGEQFNIPGIGGRRIESDPLQAPKPPVTRAEGQSFKEVLEGAVGEVQRLQSEADITIKKLVSGEIKDVTQAMVAVEKADVAFQTMMAFRNKMVQAYEEVMRMQI